MSKKITIYKMKCPQCGYLYKLGLPKGDKHEIEICTICGHWDEFDKFVVEESEEK